MRLLVAVASHGTKNLAFLNRIIAEYRSLPFSTRIVVLSEGPKPGLDSSVELKIGLPSKNPWSLPFAHKSLFRDHLDDYDLFVYTEDDISVPARSFNAFLSVAAQLQPDEIPGFMRYEVAPNGSRTFPDVRGPFHWRPETVCQRGPYTLAEFSNEHAAFFVLTRDHLKRVIATGRFLVDPYEGAYDMLCTAATDPYSACGLRKLIPISHIDEFVIHHLPNRYTGDEGAGAADFGLQLKSLQAILEGGTPASVLFSIPHDRRFINFSKNYYEPPRLDLLSHIPAETKRVLSIGCGAGESESELVRHGMQVTALPLDMVIGSVAAHRGILVISGRLHEALAKLDPASFDVIMLSDVLQLVDTPAHLLQKCLPLLRKKGTILLCGPNSNYLFHLTQRFSSPPAHFDLARRHSGMIRHFGPAKVSRWLKRAGFEDIAIIWQSPPGKKTLSGAVTESRGLASLPGLFWRKIRNALLGVDAFVWSRLPRLSGSPAAVMLRPAQFVSSRWIATAIRAR